MEEYIVHTVPKFKNACYIIRCVYNFSNIETIKMIYYAYFLSIMKHGIVFWGYSMDIKRVFQLQKNTMRVMMGVNSRSSRQPVFKALQIMTVAAQYILSLMTFCAHHLEYFTFNNSIHSTHTRRRLQLHIPARNLASYQKGVYYTSIKTFNILPKNNADSVGDRKQFVQSLRSLLIEQSFYTINEFSNSSDSHVVVVLWRMHHILHILLRLFDECVIFHVLLFNDCVLCYYDMTACQSWIMIHDIFHIHSHSWTDESMKFTCNIM